MNSLSPLQITVRELQEKTAQFRNPAPGTKVLSPLEFAFLREELLARGLSELAAECGIAFRDPLHIDAGGEFRLNVDADGHPVFCGHFGERMAALLTKFGVRTGVGNHAHIIPENGWCIMDHFAAERMLLDQAGMQTSSS